MLKAREFSRFEQFSRLMNREIALRLLRNARSAMEKAVKLAKVVDG